MGGLMEDLKKKEKIHKIDDTYSYKLLVKKLKTAATSSLKTDWEKNLKTNEIDEILNNFKKYHDKKEFPMRRLKDILKKGIKDECLDFIQELKENYVQFFKNLNYSKKPKDEKEYINKIIGCSTYEDMLNEQEIYNNFLIEKKNKKIGEKKKRTEKEIKIHDDYEDDSYHEDSYNFSANKKNKEVLVKLCFHCDKNKKCALCGVTMTFSTSSPIMLKAHSNCYDENKCYLCNDSFKAKLSVRAVCTNCDKTYRPNSWTCLICKQHI